MSMKTTNYIFALLMTALCCCSVAEPLPLRVRDSSQAKPLSHLPDEVLEACDILDVECEATKREYGSLTVDLVELDFDEHPRVLGRSDDKVCRPSVWVDPTRPERVAHEIAHIFELNHVVDTDNLMHIVAGTELTDNQFETLHNNMGLLLACRLKNR